MWYVHLNWTVAYKLALSDKAEETQLPGESSIVTAFPVSF